MPIHDFTSQRLYLDVPLSPGATVACTPEQANYLGNVLRMGDGDALLVFNGRDGEWKAALAPRGKRNLDLVIAEQIRPQDSGPDIDYLFAPLKRSRLDYMVQKATEMGVARLRPVITRHTQAERVNMERMRANAIEAAEQCGILRIPEVAEPVKLERVLAGWDESRRLIFCDEATQIADPVETLRTLLPHPTRGRGGEWGTADPPTSEFPSPPSPPREGEGGRSPFAVLIGPEGGFSRDEREMLIAKPYTLPISLGPRIMRADTAAVAALALINAVLGDWTDRG